MPAAWRTDPACYALPLSVRHPGVPVRRCGAPRPVRYPRRSSTQPQKVQIVYPRFPHPIEPLGCFIPQIASVEVATQTQYERRIRPICLLDLPDLCSFLLSTLVRVGIIAG